MSWFIWRRIHCLAHFRRTAWFRTDDDYIDAGYCLDRYNLIDVKE
jgi:hypothetical protein